MSGPLPTHSTAAPASPRHNDADMRLPFIKMQGLGNDFVMLSQLVAQDWELDPDTDASRIAQLTRFVCDRHFGIGADGLIFPWPVHDGSSSTIRFVYFNSDGSQAEMCGNGMRCFAQFVKNEGLVSESEFAVDTPAGAIQPAVHEGTDQVTVDMGRPVVESTHETLYVAETAFPVSCVSMGNPHCLIFQEDLKEPLDPAVFGPMIETHSRFPARTNVEFIEIVDRGHVKVVVWERGCGFTLACGTGACAVAVAGIALGKLDHTVAVDLPGGTLHIQWDGRLDSPVLMRGPATRVFEGEIMVPSSIWHLNS